MQIVKVRLRILVEKRRKILIESFKIVNKISGKDGEVIVKMLDSKDFMETEGGKLFSKLCERFTDLSKAAHQAEKDDIDNAISSLPEAERSEYTVWLKDVYGDIEENSIF